MSHSKEIMSLIHAALNVYCECDCMSSFPGREDEPRAEPGNKALARGIANEIQNDRLLFLHVLDWEDRDE